MATETDTQSSSTSTIASVPPHMTPSIHRTSVNAHSGRVFSESENQQLRSTRDGERPVQETRSTLAGARTTGERGWGDAEYPELLMAQSDAEIFGLTEVDVDNTVRQKFPSLLVYSPANHRVKAPDSDSGDSASDHLLDLREGVPVTVRCKVKFH